MKRIHLSMLLIGCLFGVAILVQPLTAQTNRNRSLEERVAALELQVAALNLQMQSILGTGGGTGTKRKYTGIGDSWIITNIWPQNTTIVLGNGSKWLIAPGDRSMLYKWKNKQVVVIGESTNRDFPYSLRNTERNEQVEAQYVGTG